MTPYVYNVDTEKYVDANKLFGKDARKLLNACYAIYKNWLYPYEGCYIAKGRPSIFEMRGKLEIPEGSSFAKEAKKVIRLWYEEHPEEKTKEIESRKSWEESRDKQFRIVYGIAKRHGLHIEWHGKSFPCYGEQFELYRNHESVGRIYCF